ncbi:hypothetical protein AAII07_57090 [Microvirga sp. 0TCS3.31]
MDIQFSNKRLFRPLVNYFSCFRCRWQRLADYDLLCGREDLDPAWKVVLAFVSDEILKTSPNGVLAVENNLVFDIDYKEAPFRGDDINPTDRTLAKALHWVRWVEVNAHLIPNRNVSRYYLSHSQVPEISLRYRARPL